MQTLQLYDFWFYAFIKITHFVSQKVSPFLSLLAIVFLLLIAGFIIA